MSKETSSNAGTATSAAGDKPDDAASAALGNTVQTPSSAAAGVAASQNGSRTDGFNATSSGAAPGTNSTLNQQQIQENKKLGQFPQDLSTIK